MNKKLLPVIAVIGLIAIAGIFFLSRKSLNSEVSDSMMKGEGSTAKFTGSFADLISKGQNFACNFVTPDDAGNVTAGSTYVAEGGAKVSAQFTTEVDGKKTTGNVIRDGEYNYIWTSDQAQGIKTKITEDDKSLFGADASKSESTGLTDQEQVDFDCNPWTVDNSKFTPPSDIEFVDASEFMMQMQKDSGSAEESSTSSAKDCSTCDQVPAAAQAQCRQALGC